jgi:hypothetical protein
MIPRLFALIIFGLILVGCEEAAQPSSPSLLTPGQAIATSAPNAGATHRSEAPSHSTPTPIPAGPPSPPTSVAVTRHGCYTGPTPDGIPSGGECITKITWKEAATSGTEIWVYGVTVCLSATPEAGNGSCLVADTSVPADVRKLIAKVPASDGTISWTGPPWQDVIDTNTGGPAFTAIGVNHLDHDTYFAIVVAAYNDAGHSKFIVADAGTWCYDTGCEGP